VVLGGVGRRGSPGELARVCGRERAGRESPPPKGLIPGLGRVRKRAGEWACRRPAVVTARSSAPASSRPGIEKGQHAWLYWVLVEAPGVGRQCRRWSSGSAPAAHKAWRSREAAPVCPRARGGKERFIGARESSHRGFDSSRGGGDRGQRGQARRARTRARHCWRIKDVSTYDPQAYGPTPFSPGIPKVLVNPRSKGTTSV
jgi:hypothetical protein